MTDNEIIKALECCLGDNPPCFACKYDGDTTTVDECMGALMKDAFDLINRQKAEIERLQKENEQFAYIGKLYSEIKAEAVKEFAELLNKEAENVCIDPEGDFVETDDKIYDTVANWCRATSDKLLKETVGEG